MPNGLESADRVTVEQLIRAATGGSHPGDNDVLVYTPDGFIFDRPRIDILTYGVTTYDDLQDYVDIQSAGIISGGTISDSGSGEIDVAAGTGMIKTTDSDIGNLIFFDWAAETNLSLTNLSINWIWIDYNSGSPQVGIGTTLTADLHTQIVIGRVYRSGTTVWVLNVGQDISDYFTEACLKDFEVYGMQRASGEILGETGTRNITVSAGVDYCAHNRLTTAAINTSGADTFSIWYSSGSTSADATGQSAIDNANYWNGSAYVNLTTNRYTTKWVYRAFDGSIHVQPGVSNVATIASAEGETVPTPPSFLANFTMLIGRIIIQQGGTSFESIASAFEEIFVGTGAVNHNDLATIQGGTAGEYYHLTSAEHVELNAWLDDVTLGADGAFTSPKAVTGETLVSTVAGGTAPLTVTSTTLVDNLNADTLDGQEYTALQTEFSPIAGSASILTVGTIGTGVWQGTVIDSAYIDQSLSVAQLTTTGATTSGGILFGTTNLYESAANLLKTDDAFTCLGGFKGSYDAGAGATFFEGAASGENQWLTRYGWDTAAGAKKYGRDRVDSSGSFVIQAEELLYLTAGAGLNLVAATSMVSTAGAGQSQYYRAGNLFLWQDVDAANATRMHLVSSTGLLRVYGEVQIDGNLNHDGGNFGALGKAPQAQQAFIADATDAAETMALVNSLKNLVAVGFGFMAAS